MKISDINKINTMIEHFGQLCRMCIFLEKEQEYLRLTVGIDSNRYSSQTAKIGIFSENSSAPELYNGFRSDLLELLNKRKARLHKLLNKNGVDCEINELEGSKEER